MTRDEALDSSLDWIIALDDGYQRKECRHVLRMAQAIHAMFGESAWSAMQQQLIERS